MKRKRSGMGFDTEEFQRPAKRPRLDNDNHQPEVDPQEMFAQTAFSYHTGCGSTDSQADGQEKSHVIQPARETRPGPTDCQTSSYPQIQSESKQETIEKNPVNLSAVETWFDSTDIRTSKYLLSDQTATPEVDDVTPSDTLDYLLSLINEYLYETTPVPSASSVIQKLTEPVNNADLVQIAAATDEHSRSPTTDGLHSLPQTASSASALLASVDGDRSQSRNVEHDLPTCSGSVIKSHSGTVQTTSTDSELQSEYGSIRHKKVPRRRSSNESESKTRANFERVSRTHFSEKDTTRKSASRKREHEKDASYESAPRKRSSEKSASQKQSSTKNATRKRRFSRSKSPTTHSNVLSTKRRSAAPVVVKVRRRRSKTRSGLGMRNL